MNINHHLFTIIRKLIVYIFLVVIAWFILAGTGTVYYVANSSLFTDDFKDGDSFTVYPFVIQDSATKTANSRTGTCTLYGMTIVETVEPLPAMPDVATGPADVVTPSPSDFSTSDCAE